MCRTPQPPNRVSRKPSAGPDIGRNNPFIPNSGEPHLGSNTDGPSGYSYTTPSSVASSGEETLSKPAGYGTNNEFIPNSGAPHLGSNTDGM